MTGQHQIQIITTSVVLAGEQRARIDSHAAGTPEAYLSVLWGSLMLTLSGTDQARHLQMVIEQARHPVGRLPMLGAAQPGGLDHRLSATSTSIRLWGTPTWGVTHRPAAITTARRIIPEHVAITLGSVTFQVLDQTAYRCTLGITARVSTLAEAVFAR